MKVPVGPSRSVSLLAAMALVTCHAEHSIVPCSLADVPPTLLAPETASHRNKKRRRGTRTLQTRWARNSRLQKFRSRTPTTGAREPARSKKYRVLRSERRLPLNGAQRHHLHGELFQFLGWWPTCGARFFLCARARACRPGDRVATLRPERRSL